MRVFITGGAGYIGSVCVEEVLNAGHEVCVFDNLSEGHRSAIDPRAKFVYGDLLNADEIAKAVAEFAPEAVIHFAGKALVGESMTNPYVYYAVNVTGGTNLLKAMVQSGCRKIVFSSTCATYGIPEKVPMAEDTAQNPINPYGHSKLIFEQVLAWFEKVHGITYTALRYFNAAGASERYGEDHRVETHLIPNVLKVALGQSEKVSIFGDDFDTPDGSCVRDYIHIIDLASAHILALSRQESGKFNLGNGKGYSVKEVIDVARKVTGKEIPAEVGPRRAGDPARLIATPDFANQTLGWKPKYDDLEKMVQSAWSWHVKYPNGYGD